MAKNRSDLSKWPSRYSPGGWVTAAQFIIELVCAAHAKRLGKDLPLQFWNIDEWQSEYKSQTRATHKLLKKYEAQAIINAIRDRNIWSLRPKWVENVISAEQKKIDAKRLLQKAETGTKPKDETKPIIVENKRRASMPSKISKLLAIDEENYGKEKE
jgi:hypothetical protein